MTLQQLKYMIIVAERGSITEAAKELYISQSRQTMRGYVLGNFFIYSVINAFTPGLGNILK